MDPPHPAKDSGSRVLVHKGGARTGKRRLASKVAMLLKHGDAEPKVYALLCQHHCRGICGLQARGGVPELARARSEVKVLSAFCSDHSRGTTRVGYSAPRFRLCSLALLFGTG